MMAVWTLACVVAWLMLWWPHSRIMAWVGVTFGLLGFSAVLALEFVLLRRVHGMDPAPKATGHEMARAWLMECLVFLRVFAWRQPFRWRAVGDQVQGPPDGRRGVVFVHGFGCNRGFWTPWLQRLHAQGRQFVAVNLEPPFASIDAQARCLDAAVDQVRRATGRAPVLVCHSMGGLVARAWLRDCPSGQAMPREVPEGEVRQGGLSTAQAAAQAIAHVITIGSPHAGTWLARFGWTANGRQMRSGSPWLQALAAQWRHQAGPAFTCWWSNADNMVMPPGTATLPGADNRMVRGLGHVQMAFDARVMNESLALIAALD